MPKKEQKPVAFMANVKKCPRSLLAATHFRPDGTCRCTGDSVWVNSVDKILVGAHAALEMLSAEELREIEQHHAAMSDVSSMKEDQSRHTAIALFVRLTREGR